MGIGSNKPEITEHTTSWNTGLTPRITLATLIQPAFSGTNATSRICGPAEDDADLLRDKFTVDRGRRVGTLCFVFSGVRGVNSVGMG